MKRYKDIVKKLQGELAKIYAWSPEEQQELGEKAMELISDDTLYASTDGITYPEAIALATLLYGDINDYYKHYKEDEELMPLYFEEMEKAGKPTSLEGYDEWKEGRTLDPKGERK